MNSLDLESHLRKVVAAQLVVDEDRVVPGARFVDDLNAESLDLAQLVMALEEEFGVEFSSEDFDQIVTVGDALAFLQMRLQTT